MFLLFKAKDMTFLRPTTGHLFSKGIQNQKDVLPSIVRAEVSKSVGLIHFDGNAMGTGFRVGENYIVTCAHVIMDAITGILNNIIHAPNMILSISYGNDSTFIAL